MVTKVKASENGSDSKFNPVIYDEFIDKNKIIHMYVDINEIDNDKNRYHEMILWSRGIPQKANNLDPDDPRIDEAWNVLSHLPEKTTEESDAKKEAVVEFLRNTYQSWITKMEVWAWMLAATKQSDFTGIDPKPYKQDDVWTSSLPGLPELKEPIPSILNPTEYRLKQLLDVINEDRSALQILMNVSRTLPITVRQKLALSNSKSPGES